MHAVAYARYSTDNQTENSIAYQLQKIEKYCKDNSIQLVDVYTDEGQSGTNLERAGFINMISAAKRKEFDAIIIYDISRGSRDVGDWFNFRKIMASLNIRVISCTQNLGDIYNSSDFLTELISVGLGQHQVLETRQKSIAGVAVKAEQGKFLGGIAPLGYDIEEGNYVINPNEAAVVKKIFTMYADGSGYGEIINALNGAVGKKGRPLGKNSISVILRNERYVGTYFWNKRKVKLFRRWAGGDLNPDVTRIENAIPPIVDVDIWEAAQMRLNDNKGKARNKAKRTYLLSGLIECSSCGASYVGHCVIGRKKPDGSRYETTYYTCGNKYRTKSCKSKNINADELETFVMAQIKEYLRTTDFAEVSDHIAKQINEGREEVNAYKKTLEKVNMKIKNGVNAILNGADLPELSEEITRLRSQKSELEEKIQFISVNKKQADPREIEKIFIAAAKKLEANNARALVTALVQKIYADPDGSATVEIGININAGMDKIKNTTLSNSVLDIDGSGGGI